MKSILVLLLFSVVFPLAHASAQDLLGDAIKSEMVKQNTPGVSMAVIKNGQTIFRRSFGLADVENQIAVDSKTYFHFASITKTLTAISVMQLVEAKSISLDQPIVSYLPNFKMSGDQNIWRKITVAQLLSHSSGIPRDHAVDFWFNLDRLASGSVPDDEELRTGVESQSMVFQPGTRLKYSNMGFCILGKLVAEMGGAKGRNATERYKNYVQEHILHPLGMLHSSFEVSDPDETAVPYSAGPEKKRAVLPLLIDSGAYVPAWGLVSTTEDMETYAKWILAVSRGMPNRILSPASMAMMTVPVLRDLTNVAFGYGYGFMTQDLPDGTHRFYHSGTYPGFRTFLSFDPRNNFAVVFMSNAIDTNREAYVNLAYQVLGSSFQTKNVTQPSTMSSQMSSEDSSQNPSDLTGQWQNTNEIFKIEATESGMVVKEGGDVFALTLLSKSNTAQTFQLSDNGFYTGWLGEKITFQLDALGKPICAIVGGAYENFPLQKQSKTINCGANSLSLIND